MSMLDIAHTQESSDCVTLLDGQFHNNHLNIAKELRQTSHAGKRENVIIIIEERPFLRECLARSMRSSSTNDVAAFASVAQWLDVSQQIEACLVILCVARPAELEAHCDLAMLLREIAAVPTVILADKDDLNDALAALDRGAKGYLSTNIPFEVAMEAMHFVSAGGTYVPVEYLLAAKSALVQQPPLVSNKTFTSRELSVIQAIRKGKSNKVIAYDLNMCESTVKVHVRHIMKKLAARNRTEVAIKAAEFVDA